MKIFAIFGNPVAHSKSPLMHNLAFRALGYDACYGRYRLEEGSALKEKFFELSLSGINITVPHKEHAYRACDHLDPFAKKVGAVNTIVERGGALMGFNTDAPGFLKVLREFGQNRRVLFLGAGGTALSSAAILRDNGYDVSIANRSAPRLQQFAKEGFETLLYDEMEGTEDYEIVVNMTSAGLDDDSLPMDAERLEKILQRAEAAIDVIYGKKTPFLSLAKSLGKTVKDGSEMLLYQGILAFDIFTEGRFSFDEIERVMRRAFIL
jgi:shikimate dehydrogenase